LHAIANKVLGDIGELLEGVRHYIGGEVVFLRRERKRLSFVEKVLRLYDV
jgi:hypothetical protein